MLVRLISHFMGPFLAARSTRRSARAPQTTRYASKEGLEIGFAYVYFLSPNYNCILGERDNGVYINSFYSPSLSGILLLKI